MPLYNPPGSGGYPAEPVVSGTPVAGQVLTATSATAADWAAVPGTTLTRAAILAASGSATANTIVPVNTTSAAVTVTLPAAPAQGAVIAVKCIIFGIGNNVTIACAGSDVFNKSGGGTTLTLQAANQGSYLVYDLTSGIWTDLADDLPLSYLDTLFVQVSSLPLAISSGGTGTATGAPQNDVFAGPSTGGTGTPLFRALVAADLPTGTTSAKGALQLDGTAGDIQPVGTTAAAGSVGKPPDAGHVHVGPLVGGTNFGPAGFGVSNSTRAVTANLLYLMTVQIPVAVTLTGLMIENGTTASGNILVGIYNSAGSSLLASSSSTAQGSPNTVQQIPFTGTYAAAAGTYVYAVLFSSSSATAAAGFAALTSTAAQGSFALPSSVTPPTAPAAITYPAISY